MNVSELLVRYLRALGVRHVFGYPGDPTVELLEANFHELATPVIGAERARALVQRLLALETVPRLGVGSA